MPQERPRWRSGEPETVGILIGRIVQESLAAGALGYVIKPNMVVDLPKAIREPKTDRLFVSATSAS